MSLTIDCSLFKEMESFGAKFEQHYPSNRLRRIVISFKMETKQQSNLIRVHTIVYRMAQKTRNMRGTQKCNERNVFPR